MPSETQGHVEVRLTPDEALVLFEFLFRYSDGGELRIADQSEQRALWNLCCLLEKQLVEPFKAEYVELLEAARSRLRDEDTNSASLNGGSAPVPGNSGAREGRIR